MKSIQPYLNFDGNAREAMTFYRECLGGTLDIQTFADAHIPTPPGAEQRVMHARLTAGPVVIMASDIMPGSQFVQGTNVHLNIDCDSVEELDRVFAALGQGGTVTMPLADQFWGARFGMLTDRFGVHWMLNCYHKR